MNIQHLLIDKKNKRLQFTLTNAILSEKKHLLSFEYLRVSSPTKKANTIVSHKKQTQLIAIENVAKHGFRFIFDDEHNAIYSESYLLTLITEQKTRWLTYLNELKSTGHSREAMIDIKQV